MAVGQIRVTGLADLGKNIKKLSEKSQDKAVKLVNLTANDIRTNMVKAISKRSAGRKIERNVPNLSRSHVVSKPGDAPNTDTGNLVSSIFIDKAVNKPLAFVKVQAEYAEALEFGTRDVAARPFAQPAVDKAAPEMLARAKRILKDIAEGK